MSYCNKIVVQFKDKKEASEFKKEYIFEANKADVLPIDLEVLEEYEVADNTWVCDWDPVYGYWGIDETLIIFDKTLSNYDCIFIRLGEDPHDFDEYIICDSGEYGSWCDLPIRIERKVHFPREF